MSKPGVFVISLDTELAWGRFDTDSIEQLRPIYEATPSVIEDLISLFDRYDIPATWALVAHLLSECDGVHDDPAPSFDWVDWMAALPCRSDVDRELWYGPEILSMIQNADTDHEIGLHGYTHMVLGANGCSSEAAATELDHAFNTMREKDVNPRSFVFPRNKIGHRDLLGDRGINVYRGLDARWFERRVVPHSITRCLRFAEECTQLTPPMVTPKKRQGMVEIQGSQLFRPYHGGWEYTPRHSQRDRAIKGLQRASETGDIFHLWFHPSNLARDPMTLLTELEEVLEYASELRRGGNIDVLPMGVVADIYRDGRWQAGEDE